MARFISIACLSFSMHVRALGIWWLLLGTKVRSPNMPSVSDLFSSCMGYKFMEDYSEIAKSDENRNVEQESQHCCRNSVINQVKHVLFFKFFLTFRMETFVFLSRIYLLALSPSYSFCSTYIQMIIYLLFLFWLLFIRMWRLFCHMCEVRTWSSY
jgi:hypothetical protein